jgi:hypothetical protein
MTNPNSLLTSDQLDWYNQGIILLMNVMKGRAIERSSAEFKVYEDWRKSGHLISTTEDT